MSLEKISLGIRSFLSIKKVYFFFFFFSDASQNGEGRKKDCPFFRCNLGLAIPNIVMQPTLDEVQQVVNKAVQMVVGVSKGVMQWSKERKSKVSFFFKILC